MKRIYLLILISMVFFQGCATSSGPASLTGIQYKDSSQTETLTIGFGQTDLQQMAEKMSQSLLQNSIFHQGSRVYLSFGSIKNNTDDRSIDTKLIDKKIRKALINSGKVLFTNFSNDKRDNYIREEIINQQEFQHSGRVNADTIGKKNDLRAADYFLIGDISSINKRNQGVRNLYLVLTLQLVDPESGLTIWIDEKEITKTAKRPILGW